MFNLENKVAIVTGAASGIGLATVKAFVEKGAKVVLADYDVDKGKQATQELADQGYDVIFIDIDVSDEQKVKAMVESTVEKYGQLDVMVNNAGVGHQGQMHETSDADYKHVIAINQDGVFYGCKYAVQAMLKSGGGAIVNTSSILGMVGDPTTFAYNASKGAIRLMTKSIALQYAKDKIRANTVHPGYVESGMVSRESLGEFYDGLVAKHPVGRLGVAEEIAHAIVFMVENEFLTGTEIVVDGGYTAQ